MSFGILNPIIKTMYILILCFVIFEPLISLFHGMALIIILTSEKKNIEQCFLFFPNYENYQEIHIIIVSLLLPPFFSLYSPVLLLFFFIF